MRFAFLTGVIIILTSILNLSNDSQDMAQAALLGLTFEELSRQAELIILGVVLDEKPGIRGSVGLPLENRTISIEKVIKGTYTGSTVSVITESEIMEDAPQFKQGERVILFLYREPLFGDKPSGNDYTVVNQLQGKAEVDEKGLIRGYIIEIDNMKIADFEKKVADTLSSPKTNNTQASSDANYYRNDTDLIFSNDSDTAELLRYENITR